MNHLFIVGAGTMGSDIAYCVAKAGIHCDLFDSNNQALKQAELHLQKRVSKAVQKGEYDSQTGASILGRMTYRHTLPSKLAVDYVIETVSERIEVKKAVFCELEAIVPPETVIATNTSSILIHDIAVLCRRPERIIGLHFFNPASVMKLVEIIPTIDTNEATLQATRDLAQQLEKIAVEVKEVPGFLVNRMLVAMVAEAIRLYERGVASAEDIDASMKYGANHPIGPLALTDLIGLDIVLHMMQVMHHHEPGDVFRPSPLLIKMVEEGKLGRKSGEGFFKYS